MDETVLGHLRKARAALLEERETGKGSRELSVTLTLIDTAILWRQQDLTLKLPAVNEVAHGCRTCADCEGQDHHLMPDCDDETGEPIMACKHCDFQRAMTEDDVLD